MLVLRNGQMTLWEQVLPQEVQILSDELRTVDEYLDDPRFFEPYLRRFNTRIGRPTIKVETYIRLMYLKFRYQLGYETLVKEVADSISWRKFCRISLDEKVPHSTTLIKLTKKYGSETIDELNQLLLEKAKEQKLIRGRKLRVDTTVIESDIHHPTDAGLLQDGIKVITRTVKKIKETGVAVRTKFQDRTRSVKKRVLNIAKVLKRRTGQAIEEVNKITADILTKAESTVEEATTILKNASHKIWRDGDKASSKAKQLVQKLKEQIDVNKRVIEQSKEVVSGNRKIPDRVVSIHDTEARPIRKGKLKAPTEFGYKVLVQETEDRLITGYEVHRGNPSDESLLAECLDKHEKLFGKAPWGVATDRGFGSKANEELCAKKGVKRASLPRRGRLSQKQKAKEKENWFKRLQRWRAGGEGTISVLKRKYGLRRSLSRGYQGTKIWVASGIFAYNLQKLASLI
ncbi:MAG: ISNCY family transposase [Thermoanaerobacteraceae bacterium]|nr:ISNCY family transposase [Thermoanaerobacteraceae bacterium]